MLRFAMTLASLVAIGSPLDAAPKQRTASPTSVSSHAQLVKLFTEWRAFNHPAIVNGRPDSTPRRNRSQGMERLTTRRLPPGRS